MKTIIFAPMADLGIKHARESARQILAAMAGNWVKACLNKAMARRFTLTKRLPERS
jgi:hypothetical protein